MVGGGFAPVSRGTATDRHIVLEFHHDSVYTRRRNGKRQQVLILAEGKAGNAIRAPINLRPHLLIDGNGRVGIGKFIC